MKKINMKNIMWIISIIPMIVTAIVCQFLPERIPMHYNFEGEIDRWGSRGEQFLFPVIILAMSLFWNLMINYYEGKIKKNKGTEKELKEAESNCKVLGIVGISQATMFGVMHFAIMYGAWEAANIGATHMTVDVVKLTNILLGVIFIVFGNIMPKTKKNGTVGVRTNWSMYNDNTWRKINRFGGIAMVVAGLLTIFTAAIASGGVGMVLLLIYLLGVIFTIVVYSKKVYDKEKSGE